MTDREIFEKETGLIEPVIDNYKIREDFLSNSRDYWQFYSKWLEKRSEWVSVEDRMPDVNDEYNVILNNMYYRVFEFNNGYWFDDDGDMYDNITHWRPLPTPPDEAKRGR